MSDLPEKLVTRHYANGIVNARPADKGFSFGPGTEIAEGEYLRADLARQKVKALQWEPTFISGEHLRDVALDGLGGLIAYEVGVKEHYVLVNGRRLGIKKLGEFATLEAAKAAAQADYEARILSALEGYE